MTFSDELISFLITPDMDGSDGRNVLSNRELFNVTVAARSVPRWVAFNESAKSLSAGSVVLSSGESLAIDFTIDAAALSVGTSRSTVAFGIVLDGDYPGCLVDRDVTFEVLVKVTPEENLNQIDGIRPVGLALMGLVAAASVGFAVWTYVNRKDRVVKASQPMFLGLICLGTFITACSIIPLSIDDSIASQRGCDIACMAVPWLFSIGFAVVSCFVALLVAKVVFGSLPHFRIFLGRCRHFRRCFQRFGGYIEVSSLVVSAAAFAGS